MDDTLQLGFPLWIRLTHFFNFLFITLLIRSGIEIIGAHPKFYWRDDALPGSEWLRLTRKEISKDQTWTAEDEIKPLSPWLALPGRNNLGLGCHWHFWAVIGWIVAGFIYVVLLFITPQWRRLVPTSWEIFPASVAGYRHVSPFSATPRRESIQRDSAARLFLCHLHSVSCSNRYRDHDVAGTGCAVSLVPKNHGRPSGSAQFALYRSSHLYRFHRRSSDLSDRTWV